MSFSLLYLLVFYFNFPLIGLLVFKFDVNIILTNILCMCFFIYQFLHCLLYRL
ncbi:MAG: WzyE family oligosaccharide polymerase [Arsenophonus sp. NC-TX2-MAG3]